MGILAFAGMVVFPKLNPKPVINNISEAGVILGTSAYQDKSDLICYSFSKDPIYGNSLIPIEGLFISKEYKSLTKISSDYPLSSVVFKGYSGEVNGEKCVVKISANDVIISDPESLSCLDLRNPELRSGYSTCLVKEQRPMYYWLNWLVVLIIGIPLLYLESKKISITDAFKNKP